MRIEQLHAVVDQVVHAAEGLAHADRPGHRRALHLQHVLDFIEQLDGRAAFAVELVDEGDDGRVAQAADVEQLDGLRFHPVDGVDHHHRGVHRGQRAVGVFGEVLVAGGVEQVDDVLTVRELHHRRGHRDAALLFQLHPVGGGVAVGLARAHFARDLDGATEPQQFFGQGRLTRVRVRNDGKGATTRNFGYERAHGSGFGKQRMKKGPRAQRTGARGRRDHQLAVGGRALRACTKGIGPYFTGSRDRPRADRPAG